jgi:RNAse (barnase) inhibitor barstar
MTAFDRSVLEEIVRVFHYAELPENDADVLWHAVTNQVRAPVLYPVYDAIQLIEGEPP